MIATLLAEIYGPTPEARRAAAAKVEAAFRSVPFIVDVDNSYGEQARRMGAKGADSGSVRHGAERAEVGATFAVTGNATALAWLDQLYGPFGWPQITNVHRIEGGGTEPAHAGYFAHDVAEFHQELALIAAAEMRRGGGLVSAADLVGYRAAWREPLRFTWRGQEVVTAPPPSSTSRSTGRCLRAWPCSTSSSP